MTLGELIKQYRTEHGLSQGDFAIRAGFSRGYISMLENNKNPQSGLPIALTLETMQKAAVGMNITVNELFALVDQAIDLSVVPTSSGPALSLSPHERELILAYRKQPQNIKDFIAGSLGISSDVNKTKNA